MNGSQTDTGQINQHSATEGPVRTCRPAVLVSENISASRRCDDADEESVIVLGELKRGPHPLSLRARS